MGNNVNNIIEFDNVSLIRSGRTILQNISFKVNKAETLVILGPSGAGKSSILKALVGLWKLESGKIIINGTDISKFSENELLPVRKKIGFIFQGNALFDSMNVEDNVAYFLKERNKIGKAEIKRIVEESLSYVNLSGIEKLHPDELSGGMKKRVAIARAIAIKPDILLYDEPTTGIDPINAKAIINLINKIREDGTTSIVVTHYVYNAIEVGNNFMVIENGKMIGTGTANEIVSSNNKFIKEFFSEIFSGAELVESALKKE
ncbi:MAG TPA: ATP-binding cassette domain-containing protein [Ignavibacteria bacterium]|nr:ATP-binding cassette domain-containing protein [Ignavibacteria bacterium]